jgi:protein-disulfide isomerase
MRSPGPTITAPTPTRPGPVLALAVLGLAFGHATAAAQTADLAGLGFDLGATSAAIAVVEFGDFGCSACARFETDTFAQFNREFILTGRVKFKFIPFVMGSFPNSEEATRAALCAADQSAYWSMHELLYERQREWLRLGDPKAKFEELAATLGLERPAFRTCYASDATKERIDTANRTARELRLRGTPTFFINGQEALGAIPIETWRRILMPGSEPLASRVETANRPAGLHSPRATGF